MSVIFNNSANIIIEGPSEANATKVQQKHELLFNKLAHLEEILSQSYATHQLPEMKQALMALKEISGIASDLYDADVTVLSCCPSTKENNGQTPRPIRSSSKSLAPPCSSVVKTPMRDTTTTTTTGSQSAQQQQSIVKKALLYSTAKKAAKKTLIEANESKSLKVCSNEYVSPEPNAAEIGTDCGDDEMGSSSIDRVTNTNNKRDSGSSNDSNSGRKSKKSKKLKKSKKNSGSGTPETVEIEIVIPSTDASHTETDTVPATAPAAHTCSSIVPQQCNGNDKEDIARNNIVIDNTNSDNDYGLPVCRRTRSSSLGSSRLSQSSQVSTTSNNSPSLTNSGSSGRAIATADAITASPVQNDYTDDHNASIDFDDNRSLLDDLLVDTNENERDQEQPARTTTSTTATTTIATTQSELHPTVEDDACVVVLVNDAVASSSIENCCGLDTTYAGEVNLATAAECNNVSALLDMSMSSNINNRLSTCSTAEISRLSAGDQSFFASAPVVTATSSAIKKRSNSGGNIDTNGCRSCGGAGNNRVTPLKLKQEKTTHLSAAGTAVVNVTSTSLSAQYYEHHNCIEGNEYNHNSTAEEDCSISVSTVPVSVLLSAVKKTPSSSSSSSSSVANKRSINRATNDRDYELHDDADDDVVVSTIPNVAQATPSSPTLSAFSTPLHAAPSRVLLEGAEEEQQEEEEEAGCSIGAARVNLSEGNECIPLVGMMLEESALNDSYENNSHNDPHTIDTAETIDEEGEVFDLAVFDEGNDGNNDEDDDEEPTSKTALKRTTIVANEHMKPSGRSSNSSSRTTTTTEERHAETGEIKSSSKTNPTRQRRRRASLCASKHRQEFGADDDEEEEPEEQQQQQSIAQSATVATVHNTDVIDDYSIVAVTNYTHSAAVANDDGDANTIDNTPPENEMPAASDIVLLLPSQAEEEEDEDAAAAAAAVAETVKQQKKRQKDEKKGKKRRRQSFKPTVSASMNEEEEEEIQQLLTGRTTNSADDISQQWTESRVNASSVSKTHTASSADAATSTSTSSSDSIAEVVVPVVIEAPYVYEGPDLDNVVQVVSAMASAAAETFSSCYSSSSSSSSNSEERAEASNVNLNLASSWQYIATSAIIAVAHWQQQQQQQPPSQSTAIDATCVEDKSQLNNAALPANFEELPLQKRLQILQQQNEDEKEQQHLISVDSNKDLMVGLIELLHPLLLSTVETQRTESAFLQLCAAEHNQLFDLSSAEKHHHVGVDRVRGGESTSIRPVCHAAATGAARSGGGGGGGTAKTKNRREGVNNKIKRNVRFVAHQTTAKSTLVSSSIHDGDTNVAATPATSTCCLTSSSTTGSTGSTGSTSRGTCMACVLCECVSPPNDRQAGSWVQSALAAKVLTAYTEQCRDICSASCSYSYSCSSSSSSSSSSRSDAWITLQQAVRWLTDTNISPSSRQSGSNNRIRSTSELVKSVIAELAKQQQQPGVDTDMVAENAFADAQCACNSLRALSKLLLVETQSESTECHKNSNINNVQEANSMEAQPATVCTSVEQRALCTRLLEHGVAVLRYHTRWLVDLPPVIPTLPNTATGGLVDTSCAAATGAAAAEEVPNSNAQRSMICDLFELAPRGSTLSAAAADNGTTTGNSNSNSNSGSSAFLSPPWASLHVGLDDVDDVAASSSSSSSKSTMTCGSAKLKKFLQSEVSLEYASPSGSNASLLFSVALRQLKKLLQHVGQSMDCLDFYQHSILASATVSASSSSSTSASSNEARSQTPLLKQSVLESLLTELNSISNHRAVDDASKQTACAFSARNCTVVTPTGTTNKQTTNHQSNNNNINECAHYEQAALAQVILGAEASRLFLVELLSFLVSAASSVDLTQHFSLPSAAAAELALLGLNEATQMNLNTPSVVLKDANVAIVEAHSIGKSKAASAKSATVTGRRSARSSKTAVKATDTAASSSISNSNQTMVDVHVMQFMTSFVRTMQSAARYCVATSGSSLTAECSGAAETTTASRQVESSLLSQQQQSRHTHHHCHDHVNTVVDQFHNFLLLTGSDGNSSKKVIASNPKQGKSKGGSNSSSSSSDGGVSSCNSGVHVLLSAVRAGPWVSSAVLQQARGVLFQFYEDAHTKATNCAAAAPAKKSVAAAATAAAPTRTTSRRRAAAASAAEEEVTQQQQRGSTEDEEEEEREVAKNTCCIFGEIVNLDDILTALGDKPILVYPEVVGL